MKNFVFIRKVWFNTPPQTCLPQICAYAAAQIRQRLQRFGIKPDSIINFLTERASSIRQRLQDTPPLAAGRLIILVLCVVFTGCITPPYGVSEKVSYSWVFDQDKLSERKLSKNEIVYRDNPAGLPNGADVDLFGRVSWFNSLLEIFSLQESMSFEDKESLFNALFGFIPDEPTDDFYSQSLV
jgi:hypothetical protein